ncbi:MAG: DUF6268 family outer membrane beta-barrel protein [Saccharospirillaceae bacterium]|jgi:hypothetical protein|nr:hypothetical protein A3759_07330 [Thalassolituus sp. HI0120]MCH2040239.1 DUF6268 family outer membrane beta-barrel protein [Saccharospirillaceae bacterium]
MRFKRLLLGAALSAFVGQVSANGLLVTSEGPGSPDSGVGSKFSSSQMSITLPLEVKRNRQESAASYLHLDQTSFKVGGSDIASNDYYWLSVPVHYRQRRDRDNEFLIQIEPGVMTDLKSLESDSLAANLEIYGRRYRSGGGFWQFGVVIDRAFGDLNPRPALATSFQSSKQTRVLLGFPRTKITTQWGNSLTSFLHIRPAGGVWREEITDQDGAFKVSYRNWRIGMGGEFRWRKQLWLTAEIGQTRLRTIEAADNTGSVKTSRPGDDAYTQFGLSIKF